VENSWSVDPLLWIVIGIISVAAILTGAGLIAKAFSFQSRYAMSLSICLLSTILLTATGLIVPLLILAGQTYDPHSLLVDILMIGISLLVLIGFASFIVDHLAERPSCLMISAGACFAIALFPWTYQLFRNSLNDHFRIVLIQPDLNLPRSLDDFSDRYERRGETLSANQSEAPSTLATSFDESGEIVSENGDAAESGDELLRSLRSQSTTDRDWLYDDR
jgi:hypothetical protein